MKIGIIGTGYVGLVTGVGLVDMGHDVMGTDIVEEKINKISQGIVPFFEPGLEELLQKYLEQGNLKFTADLEATIQNSDVLFVCVNTPQKEDGSADMSYVESVSRSIAENMNNYKLVVEKSTVPIRTSSWIKRTISLYMKKNIDFDVASNPEFLREGSAVYDFLNPDRIVIGVESDRARNIMTEIYQKYQEYILITNIDTAELIKHASNSFLAMKISFINLLSELCENTDANIEMVAKGMGLDSRIGEQFLRAGIGYGGSCFPKDVRALIKIGDDLGVDLSLLREVDKINTHRIKVFVDKIKKALWILKGKKIALLGLAFKPETDDLRNAPSIHIIHELQKEGAWLRLYDPKAMANMKSFFPADDPGILYADSALEALEGANAALIITEWEKIRNLDLEQARKVMANPIIIDGRNVFDPGKVRSFGFEYYSIGRK